ncbi:MAG: enoyl-CoA hydratase [Rhizobiaceae bacterium]|nr:enoyl-CoA hydratase [Rhizobiaceae bacterium]
MALIELENAGKVATIRINRPEARNAMSRDMWPKLLDILTQLQNDESVGCVVLTGADPAFCAGGDVKAMVERAEGGNQKSVEEETKLLRGYMECARLLHEMPKPTLAAINGACAGAGFALALSCDLRIAKRSAKFTTAFARVAGSGDFGGSYFLSKMIGTAKARELYYLADAFTADQAAAMGVVNRAVDDQDFANNVTDWAHRLANGPSVALAYMKENMNLAELGSLSDTLDQEAANMVRAFRTEDHKEAANAFVEKRRPEFKGK